MGLWRLSQYPSKRVLVAFGAALSMVVLSGACLGGAEDVGPATDVAPEAPLTDDDMDGLAAWVSGQLGRRAAYSGDVIERLASENYGLSVVLREGGLRRGSAWIDAGGTLGEALTRGLRQALESVEERRRGEVDTAELCLAHSYRDVDIQTDETSLDNVHRGIRGVEIHAGDGVQRYTPTEIIWRNLALDGAARRSIVRRGLSLDAPDLRVRTFECEQVLVDLVQQSATLLFRGNQVVELGEVTGRAVVELEASASDWLIRQVQPDGRLVYKYWPSRGEESRSNNMIRQWMASLALAQVAQRHQDPVLDELVTRNIEYNLEHFFRRDGELGLIEYDDEVKLGAVALAALAIVESPSRQTFANYEQALLRTVDHLWQADGSFRTFYLPPDRNDNQNFYPGEALLLWATLYERTGDQALLDRIMRSLDYYRQWHRENWNPAFIPWHTQAYVHAWRRSGSPDLAGFVFEMNDRLVEFQEWDGSGYPDVRGRFYDSGRENLGPPHAASTGAYLEGLIHAFWLARQIGDADREQTYRLTILRGLRSTIQLQFADPVDMFYISERERVAGGLRTTVYDNEIRVDNVQHNLMAVLRVVDWFDEADFGAVSGGTISVP